MVNLKGITSEKKIARLIHEKSKELKPGQWIEGFGWDQNLWVDPKFPKKETLNSCKITLHFDYIIFKSVM